MLSRMQSITRTGKTFTPRRFNVNHYIDNRLGVTSGDPARVRVQFRGKASCLSGNPPSDCLSAPRNSAQTSMIE
jgi:hypothetical protein